MRLVQKQTSVQRPDFGEELRCGNKIPVQRQTLVRDSDAVGAETRLRGRAPVLRSDCGAETDFGAGL
jgi:hypothetical protein